jgi:CheY-like chemotaxis protein
MINPTEWRVLVVEDEPDGQVVVAEMLRHFNIPTELAMNAEEAFEHLDAQKFNALIIDIALPDIDGLELVRKLRRELRITQPCIAITAFHTSKTRQAALEAGFDAYFPKPLDHMHFVRELEKLISGYN